MDGIMLKKTMWLVFIIWNSLIDIRKKEISLLSCAVAVVMRAVLVCMGIKTGWMGFFVSCIPGICFLALSLISKHAIGIGDGLVLLVTGWYLELSATVEILFLGLLCSAILGGCLLLFRKIHRKTEIPFVPFLLLGYVILEASSSVA